MVLNGQNFMFIVYHTGQSIPTTEQVLTWLLDNEERENGSGMTTGICFITTGFVRVSIFRYYNKLFNVVGST
jgi:hypothetical protein